MSKIEGLHFPYVSAIFKNHILIEFQQRLLNAGRSAFMTDAFDACNIEDVDDYLPLVVLIGGVQGSGKSSFINYCKKHMQGVREESTIDCCKMLVEEMAKMESVKYSEEITTAIQTKNEKYRTLLNQLKTLWCEFDDGPNSIVCSLVDSVIDRTKTSILFINVREPEQIAHLKQRIEEGCGVTVLTMAVLRNDPTDSMNDADKRTLDYAYDIWIKNSMTFAELEFSAVQFCTSVADSNDAVKRIYNGILESI